MAKRFDEDELDAPVERKRRRPKKKVVSEDEDDKGIGTRRGGAKDEDEEDEDNSLSTGNVLLDITLDFRDDCIDWAKASPVSAIAVALLILLLVTTLTGLTFRYIINYLNRPTLQQALDAYDLGSYGEAKRFAESVLHYAVPEDLPTRGSALFVLGAATSAIAEIAWNSNRQPYYLVAANYLKDAESIGFPPERRAEGYFLLGKSLYLSGRLAACHEPLNVALNYGAEDTKMIYWYQANSLFLQPEPNFSQAIRFVRLFQRHPLTTEDESFEADFLEAMILLQLGQTAAAETAFLRVPLFDRFETMRHFVSGQIALFHARALRQQAIELEASRDLTVSSRDFPIAPAPVRPENEDTMEQQPPWKLNVPTDQQKENPVILIPSFDSPSFESPDTEKLLPTPPDIPDFDPLSSWGPVFPEVPVDTRPIDLKSAQVEPWPIISPVPILDEENDQTEHPLFKRMSLIVARSEDAGGTPTLPAFDPDAILVLPTETEQQKIPSAPIPKPLPITSPEQGIKQQRVQALQQRASELYSNAIAHFQHVLRRDTFVPRWGRTAGLLEGICHEESRNFDAARNAYLRLGAYPATSEAAAADFLWAELENQLGQRQNALTGYTRAFDVLRNEPDYACHWLTKPEILERYETNLRANLPLKEYKLVLAMLYIARDVMPMNNLALIQGETYELWGEDLQKKASVTLGPEGETLQRDLWDRFRRAGDAFEQYSRFRFDATDYDRQLWRSAENYRLGKDYRNGIRVYRLYLAANWKDRQPEALYYLGEMYIHLDDLEHATESLERALNEYPNNPLVPRMRIALSKAYFETKEWKKSRQQLQLNLIGQYAPSSGIYRDSIYAIGKLLYDRGDYSAAIPYLEDAIKIHPNAIQAAEAHYCLAQSYLARAGESLKSLQDIPLDYVRREISIAAAAEQENALYHIQRTEKLLTQRQNAIGLTESERLMLRNTLFEAGAIMIKLQRYEEAISIFDSTVTRYQDSPEAMDALMQIVVAYRRMGRNEEAIPILNRAEVLLSQLVKSGAMPVENNWASTIQVQRDLIRGE